MLSNPLSNQISDKEGNSSGEEEKMSSIVVKSQAKGEKRGNRNALK